MWYWHYSNPIVDGFLPFTATFLWISKDCYVEEIYYLLFFNSPENSSLFYYLDFDYESLKYHYHWFLGIYFVFLKQLKNTRVCFEINMIFLTHKHYDLTFHGTKGCIYKYTQQYVLRSTTCNLFISHLHYNIIYTVLCMYEINIVKC